MKTQKKLGCPTLDQLTEFSGLCLNPNGSGPDYLRLSKDTKRPVDKGWPEKPWTLEQMRYDYDRFDVGLMPSSIGIVIVDNDTGGAEFFEYLKEKYGDALLAITPSSSGAPGRGHAWILCANPEEVRSKQVYFNGEKVGEIRSHRTQIRLIGEAVAALLKSEAFADAWLSRECASAYEIHQLTDGKNLSSNTDKAKKVASISLGKDTGRQLSDKLATKLDEEFKDTKDRSHCIDRWCWKLKLQNFSPAEILRILSPVKQVQERVREKRRNLQEDILDSCAAFDDMKKREAIADFSEDALLELKDWVFVAKREEFIRLTDRETLSERQFRNAYKHLFGKKDPLNEVMNNRTPVRKFRSAVYEPGRHEVIGSAINLWTPSGIKPSPGDVTLFIQLIDHMIPDPEEREILIDIMHFMVCRPDVKLMFAPIVVAKPGVGKTTLGNILTEILGKQNVSHPTQDDIHNDWTDWQLNKRLAIFNEMMMTKRRDVSNRIKPVITDTRLRIHQKYLRPYFVSNRINILAFSNYDDAVYLEPNDRRWVVFSADVAPLPKTFFNRLHARLKQPDALGAILDWLQRRQPKLDPTGHAPMTAAKRAMAQATRPEWQRYIERWIDDEKGPFTLALFSFDDVMDELRSKRQSPSSHAVKKFLELQGACKLKRSVVRGKGNYSFWSIRDHDTVFAMSHAERIDHYRGILVDL